MADRRLFLKSLLGSTVAYAFLPGIPILGQEISELPLTVYPRFVTPDWVVKETAIYFANSLRGISRYDRTYRDHVIGGTVKARIPCFSL